MPGANCSIFGCNTNRRHSGVSIFSIPKGDGEFSTKIREEWVRQITRNRQVDKDLRRQINEGTLHVCEKHFEEKCIEIHSSRKRLVSGSIPTLNLPKKSFEDTPSTSRRELQRHNDDGATCSSATQLSQVYKDLNDLKSKVARLALTGWSRKHTDIDYTLEYFDGKHALPLYSIKIDSGLGFSIAIFGWFLPDNHQIYFEHKRSVSHLSVSSLAVFLNTFDVCPGLSHDLSATDPVDGISEVTRHTIPHSQDVYCDDGPPYQVSVYFRSENCHILYISDQDTCASCSSFLATEAKQKRRSTLKKVTPVKTKAPLASCSKDRLIATVQKQRVGCKDLERRLSGLEEEIQSNSIKVNKSLETDILSILADSDLKSSPHMNFFGQQQKKLLASPNFGRRYHPHLIRFCLSIHSKSPSVYRELASSGVLVLPSERVLRDYRNFFKPKPGFHEENIAKLCDNTNQLFDVQRYVILSFDEMKIQSNLVFDKHNNELIGFVDLGDDDVNVAMFDTPTTIASHILAFMVRGAASDLKFILGY